MKAIFFGDSHLGRDSKSELEILLSFMDRYLFDSDYVFLLGDIFEFYHGYDGFVFGWYLPVVEKLRELSLSGKKIFFLEGNHEFSMGSYFENLTGSKCSRNLTLTFDGLRIYVSHGDELAPTLLHKILRSRVSLKIMDSLGPKISWMVASAFSKVLSRKSKRKDEKTKSLYRGLAAKKLNEGYDVIIISHSHIPDEFVTPSGIYMNTGDVIGDKTYVEYVTDYGFSLRCYS